MTIRSLNCDQGFSIKAFFFFLIEELSEDIEVYITLASVAEAEKADGVEVASSS